MTKRIHVGNLPYHTTERDLTSLFERAGRVVATHIITDRDTGRSKGFGFVEMGEEDAERAIAQLNHTELNGQLLSVTEARARPSASADRGVPPSRLFVGNLPYEANATELKELFSAVGLVSFISLPVERESGKPRGFAFVEFPDPAHAAEAIRRFHEQLFKGRALVVNEARARESRPPGAASPRPSRPPAEYAPAAPLDDQPSYRGGPSRRFGPDATPHRGRKPPSRSPRAEHGHGKPIRERRSGQFFDVVDDEPYDNTFMDEHLSSETSDPEGGE